MAANQPPLIDLLGASWRLDSIIVGAAWSADGSVAAFGLGDGTVALARARWEGGPKAGARAEGGIEVTLATSPRPPVSRVQAHKGACLALTADPSGGFLSGGADGRRVRLAGDGTAHPRTEFDGRLIELVAAGNSGWIALASGCDVRATGPAGESLTLPDAATALAFDRTGHRLAIAHRDGVCIVADDAMALRHLSSPERPLSLAWSPDGAYLASGLETGAMHVWRLPDGDEVVLADCPGEPRSLVFLADGSFLAASGGARATCWRFDPPSEAEPSGCGLPSSQHRVSRVASHPSVPMLAVGYGHGAVMLGQPGSEDALFAKAGGGGAVTALAFSPDGTLLAIGTEEGEAGIVLFPDGLLRRPGAQEASS
ncbi:MAG: WD40 repeat domain-containing protein [Acetobacteraceae bacterium]